MSRWVRMQAEIFDHPMFAGDEFSPREAWLWLVAKAAWKPTTHRVGMDVVEVDRGSLMVTIRQLRDAWGWGSGRVQRVLGMFENQHMIRRQNGTGKTLITICNYDKYQDGGTAAAQERHTDGTETAQERHTKDTSIPEYKEDISSDQDRTRARKSVSGRKPYPDDFEAFWKAYPTDKLMSKLDAGKAWAKLGPEDRQLAVAGVPGFRAHCKANPDYRPVHACRFLTQRRFEGFAPSPQARGDPLDDEQVRAAAIYSLRIKVEKGIATDDEKRRLAELDGSGHADDANVIRLGAVGRV